APFKPFWLLLTIVLVGAALWLHAAILAPFILSMVLAYLLEPAVNRLVRMRVPRALAISLCLLLVALTMAILFVLLVPIVSQLGPMLREQLPDLLASLWTPISNFLEQWGVELPATVDGVKAELVKLFKDHAGDWSGRLWT